MYVKPVNSYPVALKYVLDCFVTSKMIEKLDNAVFSNDDIVFGDIVTFFSSDNFNLDDDNFDDYDPKTINHVRRMFPIIDIGSKRYVKNR